MKLTQAAAVLRLIPLAAALIARLAAQDVTVSPSTWVYEDDPPDQLPAPRHALHADFPDVMLKTPDFGYVSEEVFVDDGGKVLSAEIHSTLPAYEHDLDRLQGTEEGTKSWRFEPARRAGKPVNSLIHFSVVFNPASAGVAGPEAIPRLLDARTVIDPRRESGRNEALSQEVIWAVVSVDEQGHPTAVKGAPDAVAGLLEQGVKAWRFAPARHAGRAVGQDVRVPFIIIAANNGLAKNKTPPRVTRQFPPTYPFSMRQTGMRGEVLVQFVVDIEGHVKRPFVVRSLNPAFDAPALESVRSWVFEPGRENGVPVYTQMQVPIFFALNGLDDGGSDGIKVTWGGEKSKLPYELQVDVQPKIRSLVMPVYPYELLRGDVTGSSEVSYIVDDQGRVVSSRVVKADRPEFGLALQAAVERFEYEPAIKNGRPNKALLAFEQDFLSSSHNIVTGVEYRLLRLEQKHPERIGKAGDLDSPVKAVVTRSPIFPRSLLGHATRGDALVELLIDEEGNPRLPRIVSASEPAFGYSAVEAAALWRFAPPMSKGKAVVTRVRVPFRFDFANAAPETGSPHPT
jgi:TonB family protein